MCVCVCVCVCVVLDVILKLYVGIGSTDLCIYMMFLLYKRNRLRNWQILIEDKIEREGF